MNLLKKRKRYFGMGCLAIVIILLSGCNSGTDSSADKSTFTIATWAAGEELTEFQEIVDRVNVEAGGKYKIEVLSIPSDYYIKISTFIASKKAPDFFWLTQELISKYAQLGAIADITETLTNSEILNANQYYEGVLASAEHEGNYYGLPWIANPMMVYYNKELFDDAGIPYPSATDDWTWEEFIETAQALTMVRQDSSGNDYQQYGYIVDGWPNIETFFWAGGGDIIAENGKDILIDSEESLKGLDILNAILSSGITPAYSEVASLGTNDVWFEKQRVAMYMGGIQDNFEEKVGLLKEEEQFQIGYAPMPVGLDGQSYSFDWTASTVMSSDHADNSLAYEAMEQLTLAFFEWKIAPPLKDAVEQIVVIDPLKGPALETMKVSLENARSANYIPEWNEINNLLWVNLYSGMLNDTSFDYRNAVIAIAEESRALISERSN